MQIYSEKPLKNTKCLCLTSTFIAIIQNSSTKYDRKAQCSFVQSTLQQKGFAVVNWNTTSGTNNVASVIYFNGLILLTTAGV